jgi:hypothetical protein
VRPDDLPDRFRIGDADRRRDDSGPAPPEGPAVPPLQRAARVAPFGIIGSMAVHLLPFALLLGWSGKPPETPPPIPVTLVLEKAPPAPAEKATPAPRRASENVGAKVAKSGRSDEKPSPTPAPAETKTAAIAPPHPPAPPAPPEAQQTPVSPNPAAPSKAEAAAIPPPPEKPAVPMRRTAMRQVPKPEWPVPPPRPAERARVPHRIEPAARELPHAGDVPGPAAVRDAYLAQLRVLTLRYLSRVPPGFIAGRHGNMALAIRVLGDGTIARIAVASGSGYPDIDSRFEQIIGSMARFPPLPPSYPGDAADLTLRLRFPDALEE